VGSTEAATVVLLDGTVVRRSSNDCEYVSPGFTYEIPESNARTSRVSPSVDHCRGDGRRERVCRDLARREFLREFSDSVFRIDESRVSMNLLL
jgi:hypothetical protein